MTAVLIPAPRVATVRTVLGLGGGPLRARSVLTVGIGLSAPFGSPMCWARSRSCGSTLAGHIRGESLAVQQRHLGGRRAPARAAHVEDDGVSAAFTLLKTLFAIAAWAFLAWTVWVAGRRLRGAISASARGRVLPQSLRGAVGTSVLSKHLAVGVGGDFASGIWLLSGSRGCGQRRLLAAAAFAAARDEES